MLWDINPLVKKNTINTFTLGGEGIILSWYNIYYTCANSTQIQNLFWGQDDESAYLGHTTIE